MEELEDLQDFIENESGKLLSLVRDHIKKTEFGKYEAAFCIAPIIFMLCADLLKSIYEIDCQILGKKESEKSIKLALDKMKEYVLSDEENQEKE